MSGLTGSLAPGHAVLRGISSRTPARQLAHRLPAKLPQQVAHGRHCTQLNAMMDLEERQFARMEPPEDAVNAVRTRNNSIAVFWDKCKRAWAIFFPPEESPSGRRLQMVLLAERASLPPENLDLMKASIVDAMREYVEVDDGEEVTVSFSTDPVSGIVYCVAVPVRSVINDLEVRDVTPEEHGDFIEEPDMPFWDKTGEARYPYGF